MTDENEASAPSVRIYFTDFFGVTPTALDEYGAFNVSLINDLPLFVDPFLLFDSENETYRALHEEIITYVKFLRDVSMQETELEKGHIDQWFRFPEVSQNWLGFSRTGNKGSGLGADFADTLHRNLRRIFRDFGTETVTRGSHLEKLCLLGGGVGRDHLSDFTTNLIKRFLLEYTQSFAREHVPAALRRTFGVEKVRFDYTTHRWQRAQYELPVFERDYVLLTPKDMLTKDHAWINRDDLLSNFEEVYTAAPDEHLRHQLDDYLRRRLTEGLTAKEQREVVSDALDEHPAILDHYIKQKEDDGEEAHKISGLKVADTQQQFVQQVRALVDDHLAGTEFYTLGNSFEESLKRVHFLKDVIENNDGYRLFYLKGKPLKREEDLQVLYRLTWFATPFDVNREVNNGRGPVDYKVSRGADDKTLVEFKLASNSKLKRNLEKQVAVYEAANATSSSIKVILYFSEAEFNKVITVLKALKLEGRSDVVLIDARPDNKPSGSTA